MRGGVGRLVGGKLIEEEEKVESTIPSAFCHLSIIPLH
jgi:hypothetical protein